MQAAFLAGLPRSGSTLLLNLLGQNPDIDVTGTSGLVEICNAMREQYGSSVAINSQPETEMSSRFRAACRGTVEGWSNYNTDAKIYIDKNRSWPMHYEFLKNIGIEPKIIVTVRDLRAVLSSMEKLYRNNSLRHDPVSLAESSNAGTIEGRVTAWGGGTPVGSAANMVKDLFSRKLADKVLFVRFEDLTTQPAIELERIYKFLGYDGLYEYRLNDIQQITHEDDRLHGIPNLHDIRPELCPVPDDWDDILGTDLSQAIVNGAPWFYDTFSYKA